MHLGYEVPAHKFASFRTIIITRNVSLHKLWCIKDTVVPTSSKIRMIENNPNPNEASFKVIHFNLNLCDTSTNSCWFRWARVYESVTAGLRGWPYLSSRRLVCLIIRIQCQKNWQSSNNILFSYSLLLVLPTLKFKLTVTSIVKRNIKAVALSHMLLFIQPSRNQLNPSTLFSPFINTVHICGDILWHKDKPQGCCHVPHIISPEHAAL